MTRFVPCKKTFADAFARLDACEAAMSGGHTLFHTPPGRLYIQNLKSSIVHAILLGHGERSTCGWFVGKVCGSKTKLTGTKVFQSLAGLPWFLLCERCLLSERAAAPASQGTETGIESASE